MKTQTPLRFFASKKGFTLIELIVVIAILACLAALIVPFIAGFVQKSRFAVSNYMARTAYSLAAAEIHSALSGGEYADPAALFSNPIQIKGDGVYNGSTDLDLFCRRIQEALGNQFKPNDVVTIYFSPVDPLHPTGTIWQITADVNTVRGTYTA